MNFICKRLTIDDDGEFGCTVEFSDTIDEEYQENQPLPELMHPTERYFLLQRSYSEDYYEDDYYHVETTESTIELSYKDKLNFDLHKDLLKIWMAHDLITIGLNLKQAEYNSLRKILKGSFKDYVVLLED